METIQTPVRKLLHSINEVLAQYAENLSLLAKGKEPKIAIDDKVFDKVMKMIEKTPSLEAFEAFCNGEKVKSVVAGKEPETVSDERPIGNAFEERSKKVQAKLNGNKV